MGVQPGYLQFGTRCKEYRNHGNAYVLVESSFGSKYLGKARTFICYSL